MIWTTTPPTERGYYWVRWDEAYNHTDEIVRVRPKRVRCQDTEELIALVTMSDQQHPLSRFVAFAGPIPAPSSGGEGG